MYENNIIKQLSHNQLSRYHVTRSFSGIVSYDSTLAEHMKDISDKQISRNLRKNANLYNCKLVKYNIEKTKIFKMSSIIIWCILNVKTV